ncbi:hypothetical protein CLV47_108120 [Antricoccus suffuscus]|uniref:Uncharacterized protein n=1 Tax=Antricoccus suffuscus TaxID=1629062 RepID=A0A2T0ZZH9_9ACTN|nr:hypothetical protein [Antricoccus suffuscus]PRZ41761.1 hypothetical protein CLV47_108120 [Antricoccus suffuscus]
MANNEVTINPQGASNGVAQWKAAATTTNSNWETSLQKITDLQAKAPWGNDDAGATFAGSYEEGKKFPTDPIAAELVKKVVDTGPNVETALEHSLGSDKSQASKVKWKK